MHNWKYVLFYNDNNYSHYKKLHCQNTTVVTIGTEIGFFSCQFLLWLLGQWLTKVTHFSELGKKEIFCVFSKAEINGINSNCGVVFSWKVYVCHILVLIVLETQNCVGVWMLYIQSLELSSAKQKFCFASVICFPESFFNLDYLCH